MSWELSYTCILNKGGGSIFHVPLKVGGGPIQRARHLAMAFAKTLIQGLKSKPFWEDLYIVETM